MAVLQSISRRCLRHLNGILANAFSGDTRSSRRQAKYTSRRFSIESLETRELLATVTGRIEINSTATKADNIVLYNPPGSTHVDTSQRIFGKFTYTGKMPANIELMQENTNSGGAVTIMPTGYTNLKPGSVCIFMILPTSNSSNANDVKIVAKSNGQKFAEDTMTVVKVDFDDRISHSNTPQEMLDAGAYRIPPRVNTPLQVMVMPDLAGSGQAVSLQVANQSAAYGRAVVNGVNTYVIRSGTDVTVNLKGTSQTTPGIPIQIGSLTGLPGSNWVRNKNAIESNQGNPNAKKLALNVLVRGKATNVKSAGFSVAAIPLSMTMGTASVASSGNLGFRVPMRAESDSGVSADLNQIGLGELVQDVVRDGGYFFIPPANSNNEYVGPASTYVGIDEHATPLTQYHLMIANHLQLSGQSVAHQIYTFLDARTGVSGIPVKNSGYVINKQYTVNLSNPLQPKLLASIEKTPTAVTAHGKSAAKGKGAMVFRSFVAPVP